MGIKVSDVIHLNRRFDSVKKDIELLKEVTVASAEQVQKLNKAIDIMEEHAELGGETLREDWAHVPILTESDKYPLIQTSEPGINVETQVLLRKLDII